MSTTVVSRDDVLAFRAARHHLDRAPGSSAATQVDLLDYGVQDTGPDGARWALAVRGAAVAPLSDGGLGADGLALAWTLRGAPHAYRRDDLHEVAVATAPWSEADAAKRIFDAAKPLRATGRPILASLRVVAAHQRELAARPATKGDVSGGLTALLAPEHLRACRPCGTTHIYEQPFRLSALQAGLELEPATSPPVLRRIPGLRPNLYSPVPDDAEPRFDLVRNHLRFFGPVTVRDTAAFLDTTVKEVAARWPEDAIEVDVEGEDLPARSRRFALADDLPVLDGAAGSATDGAVRLLGPYDPYVQLRDRELLVPDAAARKDLWRVLGRPGAVLLDGDVVGTWRPTTSGRRFALRLSEWSPFDRATRAAVETEAARLAEFKGLDLVGVVPA